MNVEDRPQHPDGAANRLFVVSRDHEAFHAWCSDNDRDPRDRSLVCIVTKVQAAGLSLDRNAVVFAPNAEAIDAQVRSLINVTIAVEEQKVRP